MPKSPMYYGMSNLAYVCFSSGNYAYEGWQPPSSNFTNPNLLDVYEGPNVILKCESCGGGLRLQCSCILCCEKCPFKCGTF